MRTAGTAVPIRGGTGAGAGGSWVDPVINRTTSSPPGSPSAGDRYIIAATATGVWAGKEDYIADWNGADWDYTAPYTGLTCYVNAENEYYSYNGSAWVQESFGPHATTHQDGGTDEINVAGLSGELADPQPPKTHATAHEPGGGDAMAVDATAATGSLRTLGTGAQQATAGNDSRLSDARTPLAHATTHEDGGSDEVAIENLPTAAAVATVPVSDGAGATVSRFPAGMRVIYPADDIAAILNAAADDTAYFLADGTHAPTADITLTGKSNVSILGSKAATLQILAARAHGITIDGCADIDIAGFTVDMQSTGNVFITTNAVTRVSIDHLTVLGNAANSAALLNHTGTGAVSGLRITNCSLYGNFVRGINITSTHATGTQWSGFVLANNTFLTTLKSSQGVHMYDVGTGLFTDVEILGNFFDNFLTGIVLEDCARAKVVNNVVSSCGAVATDVGIELDDGCSGCEVRSNTVTSQTGDGMRTIGTATGTRFIGNVVTSPTARGVEVNAGVDNEFINNVIDSAGAEAFYCASGATRNKFVGNTITSPGDNGFDIQEGADYAVVVGNIAYNCNGDSINVDADGSTVQGNFIQSGAGNGIECGDTGNVVDNVVVQGNTIVGKGSAGVAVRGNHCTVTGNSVINAGTDGIAVEGIGSHTTVTGNVVDGCQNVGIHTERAFTTIIGNIVTGAGAAGTGDQAAVRAETTGTDCVIQSNILSQDALATTSCIDLSGSDRCQCSGNLISSTGDHGIWINDVDEGTVDGNVIISPSDRGVDVAGGCDTVSVSNNVVFSSTSEGIYVNGSAVNISIEGNLISNAGSDGIEVDGSQCQIVGNMIYGPSNYGIYIKGVECQVQANYMQECGNIGLDTDASADRCQMVCNFILNPTNRGIDIDGDNNHLWANYIQGDVGTDESLIDCGGLECQVVMNFLSGSSASNGIHVESGSHRTLVEGNMLDNVGGDAIYVAGSDYVSVIGNVVISAGDEGIFSASTSTNVLILSNMIYASTGAGIEADGDAATVEGNHVYSAGTIGIDMGTGDYMQVIGNMVYDPTSHGIFTSSGSLRGQCVNNYVFSAGSDGIQCNGQFWQINGNYINTASGDGIDVNNDYCQINDNWIYSANINGIIISAVALCQVHNNKIQTTGGTGITVSGSNSCTIRGNNIHDVNGTTQDAILVSTSHYCTVDGNYIVDPTGSGIRVVSSNNGIVSNNYVQNAAVDGIDLETATELAVNGNRCEACAGYGISEDANCDYNLFGVNHLRGNTTGGASFNGTNRTESGNKVA